MSIHLSLSIPPSSTVLSAPNHLFLTPKLSRLSLYTTTTRKPTQIRMGGGSRTFPGGVSKWKWKRMQANKAKQLLKARLARERQIYEMRKRAEFQAAVSDLERPWEVVAKAPKLFSISADEQVKVLADRFQRPGGFDMWSEKDGPQLFSTVNGAPSKMFFPKGVVHIIKPSGKIEKILIDADDLCLPRPGSESVNGTERNGSVVSGIVTGCNGKLRNKGRRMRSGVENPDGLVLGGVGVDGEERRETPARHSGNDRFTRGRGLQKLRGPNLELFDTSAKSDVSRKKGKRIGSGFEKSNNLNGFGSGGVRIDGEQSREAPARRGGNNRFTRGRGPQKMKEPNSEVFDMRLQCSGSYRFQTEK